MSIADLEVVPATPRCFWQVQCRHVEDNLFTMGSRDTPLTGLGGAFHGVLLHDWRADHTGRLLQCATASWKDTFDFTSQKYIRCSRVVVLIFGVAHADLPIQGSHTSSEMKFKDFSRISQGKNCIFKHYWIVIWCIVYALFFDKITSHTQNIHHGKHGSQYQ